MSGLYKKAGVLVLGLLIVMAGWLMGETPVDAGLTAAAPAEIALPDAKPYSPREDLDILIGREPWANATRTFALDSMISEDGTMPLTPSAWRLAGVLTNDHQKTVMILVQNADASASAAEYRSLGETLPDGSLIVGIGYDSVDVERDGGRRTIQLFQQGR